MRLREDWDMGGGTGLENAAIARYDFGMRGVEVIDISGLEALIERSIVIVLLRRGIYVNAMRRCLPVGIPNMITCQHLM